MPDRTSSILSVSVIASLSMGLGLCIRPSECLPAGAHVSPHVSPTVCPSACVPNSALDPRRAFCVPQEMVLQSKAEVAEESKSVTRQVLWEMTHKVAALNADKARLMGILAQCSEEVRGNAVSVPGWTAPGAAEEL
jgi:hypothetical protein